MLECNSKPPSAVLRYVVLATFAALLPFGPTCWLATDVTAQQLLPAEIVPSFGGSSNSPISLTGDGRFLAIASGNGAELWDVGSDRLVRRFTGLKSIAFAAALAPDGKKIAASSTDVRIWDIESGQTVASYDSMIGLVNRIAFSTDGRRIVYAGSRKPGGTKRAAFIRDVATGQVVGSFDSEPDILSLAVSPRGGLAAIGDIDGMIRIFNIEGQTIRFFRAHRSKESVHRVDALAFSPDGRLLASGGNDQSAKIWDVATGKLLHTFGGHGGHSSLVNGM